MDVHYYYFIHYMYVFGEMLWQKITKTVEMISIIDTELINWSSKMHETRVVQMSDSLYMKDKDFSHIFIIKQK